MCASLSNSLPVLSMSLPLFLPLWWLSAGISGSSLFFFFFFFLSFGFLVIVASVFLVMSLSFPKLIAFAEQVSCIFLSFLWGLF